MPASRPKAVIVLVRPSSPKLAWGVEKVRTIKFCATIVPVTRACGKSDSMNRGILNYCFKNFDLRDFFNSLSHVWTAPCWQGMF